MPKMPIGDPLAAVLMDVKYSPLHGTWIVMRPDRPELVLASGATKEECLRNAQNANR